MYELERVAQGVPFNQERDSVWIGPGLAPVVGVVSLTNKGALGFRRISL